jgi:hypothetical protein
LGLGIGAPLAAQIAAFEKHRGANARAVVEAEFLDVKNMSGHGSASSPIIIFIVWFAPP